LADTLIVVNELEADAVVFAWTGDTMVDNMFTVSSFETIRTAAHVTGRVTNTGCLVLARIVRGADIKVRGELAVGSVEPRGARASVIISTASIAISSVSAGELVTSILYAKFTVSPGESDGAGAGVIIAGVEASGTVMTWVVVGAEVEVRVAKMATPATVTLTGVGLAAGAMDTSRVYLALVAQWSRPSGKALAFSRLSAGSILFAAARSTLRFHTVVVASLRIFFLPPIQTYLLSIRPTGVMSKIIIPGLAQDVAVCAVVFIGTDQPEVVLQLAVTSIDPPISAL